MATIQLRQVEKKFGEVYAVKPVDLTIHDGEFVVLLGPSGCGKTTTLRMIAGLETVSDGTISIDNRDVTKLRGRERDIAFVFQLFALYPHLSVYENVAFPLKAEGIATGEVDTRVRTVAKMLGIEPLLRLRPGSLSGGDRQRVALARSLVPGGRWAAVRSMPSSAKPCGWKSRSCTSINGQPRSTSRTTRSRPWR